MLDLAIRERNKDALHAWIKATTGYNIPRQSICANHIAPFDFIADALFHNFRQAIAHANRSGGKTQGVAIIEAVETYYTANLEAVNVGAIQKQADRCYGYIKEISAALPFNSNSDPRKLTATQGVFRNGSSLQILPGTPASVNGPHPQLAVLDELELMPYFVVQQAFSMAQSKANIPARTIITSTVKYATGLMVRMIDEFRERGLPVYSWCCREVMQPLPVDNMELMARIRQVFDDEFLDGMEAADGYYQWEDLITKKQLIDDETWSVEWVCNRPERSGLVYSPFEPELNTINENNRRPDFRTDYQLNPFLPIYIGEDFGFGPNNPDVMLFCQVYQDTLVVFDEIYSYGKVSRENMALAMEKLERDWGIQVVRSLQADGRILYSTPRQEVHWVPDPAGLTEIQERRDAGLSVMEPVLDRSYYQLINSIPAVRKKIADRTLQIAPICVNLEQELQSYRYKKNADGQYTDTPEKKDDHGPDDLRYLVLVLFSILAQEQQGELDDKLDMKPLTAGLRNQIF